MIKNPKRDSKGRFLICWNHPELDAEWAAENERAQKFIKVCNMLEFKPEEFGIEKSEAGNCRVDYQGMPRFYGLALGLALGLDKPRKKICEILSALCDALGIGDKLSQHRF